MATNAVFFTGYTEGLHSGVTCSAGFCLLHLSHRIALAFFKAEDGIMAHLAVIVVLGQVEVMIKNYRFGVFECEWNILGLHCSG